MISRAVANEVLGFVRWKLTADPVIVDKVSHWVAPRLAKIETSGTI